MKSSKKGNTLILVMILTAVIAIIAGSTMDYGNTELKNNTRAQLLAEAQYASKSLLEYGIATIERRFQTQTNIESDMFSRTSGNPLTLGAEAQNMFSGSHVVFAPTYNPSNWNTNPSDVVAGVLADQKQYLLQINEGSGNASSQFQGLDNSIVGAQAIPVISKATVSNSNGMSVTSCQLAQFVVADASLFTRAIFYNLDFEIAPGPRMDVYGPVHANRDSYIHASSGLYFHDTVNSAGDIYHSVMTGTFENGVIKSTMNGPVNFQNDEGQWVNMKQSDGWIDSTRSDWFTRSQDLWDDNVADGSHGIQELSAVLSGDNYIEDDPATTSVDETRNYAYRTIQPVINKNRSDYEEVTEIDKWSYKAGLTISVEGSGGNYTVKAYTYERDANGDIQYDGSGDPQTVELTLPANVITINEYSDYVSRGTRYVTGGMYDRRMGDLTTEAGKQDLVEIDVGLLADSINNDSSDWGSDTPSSWWNGVVYVQLPYESSTPRATDGVQPADQNISVRLNNGSEIPNPSYAVDEGMSLATNGGLYVNGNYNADGSSSSGGSQETDGSDEPPAALAADAVTVLSSNWTSSGYDTISAQSVSKRTAAFTEVSAAIVSGLVPTEANESYSGGVHNLPRFLEDWKNSVQFTYRGSLVCLYESEVQLGPFSCGSYYNPPRRNWGFNELFADNIMPPGTPKIRVFFVTSSSSISQSQYDAVLGDIIAAND
ncbi:MAG: hypothetical protein JW739_00500 [Opitutales bacterium]|nr:hypothetical protein [Opitutales bacterium]